MYHEIALWRGGAGQVGRGMTVKAWLSRAGQGGTGPVREELAGMGRARMWLGEAGTEAGRTRARQGRARLAREGRSGAGRS